MLLPPVNRPQPAVFGAAPAGSQVARRLVEIAAAEGLVCVPAVYAASAVGGLGAETLTITPDPQDGAFFVVGLRNGIGVSGGSDEEAEVQIRTGSRSLVEGRIRFRDLVPTALGSRHDLSACIVVLPSDSLSFDFTLTTALATLVVGSSVVAVGFHLRAANRGLRAPVDAQRRVAARVRAEGELWACGVISDVAGGDIGLQTTVQLDALSLGISAGGGGFEVPSRIGVRLGNLDVTPRGIDGKAVQEVVDISGDSVRLFDIRHFIEAGTRLTLETAGYPVGTRALVRLFAVGRRQAR